MQSWKAIASVLTSAPPRTPIHIERSAVTHPVHEGLRRTIGIPRGQFADYRLPLGEDTWLHVTEYAHEYVVHREERAPQTVAEAPAENSSGAVLGFLVGLALGGTLGAALAGLTLGAVADAGAKGAPRRAHLPGAPSSADGTARNETKRRRKPARKERT